MFFSDPYDPAVQLVLLNTCGFISSGREEAIATAKKLLKKGKQVCITGCAVKYRKELAHDPARDQIKSQVDIYPRNELNTIFLTNTPRALTNLPHKFEYLKIAEGCNNSCSFCIIPKIRGKQISFSISNILHEVQNLVHQGAEEIILIAQDSTRYGTDLYGRPQLFELLEQIEQLPWDFRYRVLYLYPDLLILQQLKKLTSFRKFIPYFDIPLQHISSSVLKRMERFYDEKAIYDFLDFIKSNFPESFIRTNFIIGFPGETEEDVKQLHAFIQQDYFDNIALFEYHDEPLAASSKLPDQIPSHIIRQRFLPLRRLVNNLLLKKQETRKGKTYTGYVQDIHVVDNPLPSVFNPSTPTESGFPSPDREEKGMERNATITVRPILHCPEIDEVDEISIDQIISCEDEELQIASKITYHL